MSQDQANQEKRAASYRKYREANRDKRAVYKRQWQQENREKVAAYNRRWRQENLERDAAAKRRRKARKRNNLTIPFTPAQLAARLSMFAGCWMCGGPATAVDHVKPIAKGGADILANLRPVCKPCNSSKGDKWEVG